MKLRIETGGRMFSCLSRWLVPVSAAILIVVASPLTAAEKDSDFFDGRIAPLLARRCLGCHNATTKQGGLNLASAATARVGGDSGPAITAGEPERSLLWQRVSAGEMPPKETLPAEEQELLRKWLTAGALWGREPIDPFRFTTDKRAGYDWWSLQPVVAPPVPQVDKRGWARNDIDQFIQAKLQASGLTPAPEAAPRILVRRLYFDLIGLPPTPQELDRWVSRLSDNRSRDHAYRELVDELLASPHYGERWARHWLDVVRFGESQGYERNRIRDNAWRYRDWVTDSFNSDLPYDEFMRRQIAGDVLYPENLEALLATGYLVCGSWDQVGHNEGSVEMRKAVHQDHLEDLVGALGQSFLGLTVQCARCHDHKFDPISQREYYQMAALLGGVTQEEKERQGINAKPSTDAHWQWMLTRDKLRAELNALEKSLRDKYGTGGGGEPIAGLLAVYRPGEADGKSLADQSGVGVAMPLTAGGKPRFASAGPATKLVSAAKASHEWTVEAWVTPAKPNQTGPARIVTLSLDASQRNFTLGQDGDHFDLRFRTSATDANGLPSLAFPGNSAVRRTHVVGTFDREGMLRGYVDGKQIAERRAGGNLSNWSDDFKIGLGDEITGDRRWDGDIHFVALYSSALTKDQIERNFATGSTNLQSGKSLRELLAAATSAERQRAHELQKKLEELDRNEPAQPFGGVAHVVIPKQPPDFHVLARGDYRAMGEVVSPAGLASLTRGGLSADFKLKPNAPEGARRTALANWLADARNPLTPRVMVNRLWHYHFGRGIVETPSDFGFSGGRPSHPELLDWLTAKFIAGGWKLKDIHRLMVMSATYRQASGPSNPRAVELDAENRLLSHYNMARLDGELIRDAALAVSGALNRKVGGASYRDMQLNGGVMGTNAEFTEPNTEFSDATCRRTIYRLWARAGNNPLLESLDCPDPSVLSPRRSQTITPVQSLALLNSSFTENCAKRFAMRLKQEAGDTAQQIKLAYRSAFGRDPQARELELARGFIDRQGLEQFCLVLLNTNEFLFVE